MRGKDHVLGANPRDVGITPAHAGKRRHTSARYECPRDHPRVCGEKPAIAASSALVWGSPPRMRGKERVSPQHPGLYRITPAYAGKSNRWYSSDTLRRDHPRVCEEKCSTRSSNKSCPGSPPRVRGKGAVRCTGLHNLRITPACAGKRIDVLTPGTMYGDHPRVCGEKSYTVIFGTISKGSPPRVRGKASAEGMICT